ncbi:MAG: methyltransferase domain-containing protein [Thauera sp.]|nr:methyltransferase domain-containing protein [Thauera sp.]
MSILRLEEWLQTPQGRYLLDWEQDGLDRLVADIFGYHAVQLGLSGFDLLRANRMPRRIDCGPQGRDLRCSEYELPFATGSLDLVLLPHVLEFSAHPHRVLREVERVLVPEGSVVISGFNPLSLWGLRRLIARRDAEAPWSGHYRSAMRIRDWLNLLGFEIQESRFGCYAPPLRTPQWLERWGCLDRAGSRWWPVLGAGYLLHGVKRVQGMRLITPHWRGRKAAAKRLSPVAQRDGSTRNMQ